MTIKFGRVGIVSADTYLVEMIQMTLVEDPHEDDGQPCAEFGCTHKIKFDSIGKFWYHLAKDVDWYTWSPLPNHQPRPKD